MKINLSGEATLNLTKPPYETEGLTCIILGNKGSRKSNAMVGSWRGDCEGPCQ